MCCWIVKDGETRNAKAEAELKKKEKEAFESLEVEYRKAN